MGLATISDAPRTPEEWAGWSFSHQASHVDIQRVIFAAYSIETPLYALDPFNQASTWTWQNQAQHTAIAKALGYKGFDLTTVDWQDRDSVVDWVSRHAEEHQIASRILGLA